MEAMHYESSAGRYQIPIFALKLDININAIETIWQNAIELLLVFKALWSVTANLSLYMYKLKISGTHFDKYLLKICTVF